MSLSDFPKSAALISEGFCPLCNGRLDNDAFCEPCDIGWTLHGGGARTPDEDVQIFGTAGVLIVPTRKLTTKERMRLYVRPQIGDSD